MQSHDNDQRASPGYIDWRRNSERPAIEDETWLALEEIYNQNYRPMCIAEPGKPFNLSATLIGKGSIT